LILRARKGSAKLPNLIEPSTSYVRRRGDLLAGMRESGELVKKGKNRKEYPNGIPSPKTLDDLDITRKEAAQAKTFFAILDQLDFRGRVQRELDSQGLHGERERGDWQGLGRADTRAPRATGQKRQR
jgi:hypothetical protein